MVGRILLGILIFLIVVIFFVPYGVDASYEDGVFRLGFQAGPFRIGILPKKPLTERQKARKARKQAKKEEKKRKAAEKAAAEGPKPEPLDKTEKIPKKRSLDIDTILALLKMGIHAIRRLFKSFTLNYFKLHLLAASNDPYTTAMEYAAACALVEALPQMCGEVIRVRHRDIVIGSDFLSEQPKIALHITLTLQLYLIVHMAVAFLVEFIVWKIKNRAPKAAAASERKADNGREQIQ